MRCIASIRCIITEAERAIRESMGQLGELFQQAGKCWPALEGDDFTGMIVQG